MAKSKKKKTQTPAQPPNLPSDLQESEIPVKAKKVNLPRLDKYQRLINRFYEPLVLLAVLGPTRGRHTPVRQATPEQVIRRRFLRNLAFICDCEKGGPTTTAIAVQERPDQFVFWFATNNAGLSEKVFKILDSTLEGLKRIALVPTEDVSAKAVELARMCTEFARKRVKDEGDLLREHAQKLAKSFGDMTKESPEGRTPINEWKLVEHCA
jgi:hypothetical protein